MKVITLFVASLVALLLFSCSSEPTLQKYFVENSEKKDFLLLDISPEILNVDKSKLSAEQKTALASFDKMNILAFKLDDSNKVAYETESQKVTQILKDETYQELMKVGSGADAATISFIGDEDNKTYQELMKVGSGADAATISFIGDEDNINEFIVFAKRKENGFAVVRILGKDMNPNNIMTMLSVLKDSNIDMNQLAPLQDLMK